MSKFDSEKFVMQPPAPVALLLSRDRLAKMKQARGVRRALAFAAIISHFLTLLVSPRPTGVVEPERTAVGVAAVEVERTAVEADGSLTTSSGIDRDGSG